MVNSDGIKQPTQQARFNPRQIFDAAAEALSRTGNIFAPKALKNAASRWKLDSTENQLPVVRRDRETG